MIKGLSISMQDTAGAERVSTAFLYGTYIVLIALFALLPSVVMPELMQPTQTGKFFAFAYSLSAAIALFLIHKLLSGKAFVVRISPLDILLGIFILYVTVNRYLLQDVWGFSVRYYELMGLSAMYVLLRQLDKKFYPWLILAVIVSGIVQAVYGNLQLYGIYPSHHSGFKMTGSFFNPGPYGGFLACVFPLALGMYLFSPLAKLGFLQESGEQGGFLFKAYRFLVRYGLRYIPIVAIISILLVLPASQSRAAWLSVILSSAFLLGARYKVWSNLRQYLNTPGRKLATVFLFTSLAAAIGWGLYTYKQGSADGRLLIWKVTAAMIMDKPWLGNGFDRFKAEYMNYQAGYFRSNPESAEAMVAGEVYYAFNEPLQLLAENGAVGFLLLAAIILLAFRTKKGSGEDNNFLIISKAGLSGVFIFSLFSYPAQLLPVKVMVVLLLAMIAAEGKSLKNSPTSRMKRPVGQGLRLAFSIAIFAGSVFVIQETNNLHAGYKEWKTALATYQMGAYESSLEEYKSMYPIFHKEGDFLMNYGKALSMAGEHDEAVKVLKEAKFHLNSTIIQTALGDSFRALKRLNEAEVAYFQAWYMIPARFYPKYLLAKFFNETGQKEKALKIASELMEKDVKVESPAIREMRAEMEGIIKNSINESSS